MFSSRHCESCDLDVKIGTGGEHNWKEHLASTDHVHKGGKKSTPTKHLTFEDLFCSECELIIPTNHLLKCNEPSCTEKVFPTYNAVLKSVDVFELYSTTLHAKDLSDNLTGIGFVMTTAKRMQACESQKVDTGRRGET